MRARTTNLMMDLGQKEQTNTSDVVNHNEYTGL